MDGDLSAFKPHHRMSAARELLSRGFGKHAREAALTSSSPRRSGEEPVPGLIRDRNPEEAGSGGSHSSLLSTHSSEESQVAIATADPDPEEEKRWAEINEIIDAAIERSDRIVAEQAEKDPDNIPYVRDLSAFNEAWENSQKWMEEWKNSIDPEEYQAIIKEKAANFDAKIETRIERRKQIAADRERRAKGRRPNARPSRPKPGQKLKPKPSQSLKSLPTPDHLPPARNTSVGPPLPTSRRHSGW